MQELAGGTRRLAAAAVGFVWFGLSVALGLALFAGVLGFGHGGRLTAGVYGVLAIINAIFFGFGWLMYLVPERLDVFRRHAWLYTLMACALVPINAIAAQRGIASYPDVSMPVFLMTVITGALMVVMVSKRSVR